MDFDPRRSLTRNEFCYAEHLSLAKYFDLKKRNLTPVELNIDGIFRITPEAREEWRARMPKNVTPSLHDYLESKVAAMEAAE